MSYLVSFLAPFRLFWCQMAKLGARLSNLVPKHVIWCQMICVSIFDVKQKYIHSCNWIHALHSCSGDFTGQRWRQRRMPVRSAVAQVTEGSHTVLCGSCLPFPGVCCLSCDVCLEDPLPVVLVPLDEKVERLGEPLALRAGCHLCGVPPPERDVELAVAVASH